MEKLTTPNNPLNKFKAVDLPADMYTAEEKEYLGYLQKRNAERRDVQRVPVDTRRVLQDDCRRIVLW